MRPINLLVIHCSATPNGHWTTTADIDFWHRQRGFHRQASFREIFNPQMVAIGYHHVIYTTGAIATGRSHPEVGAHAAGHNATSLGICMIGTDRFNFAQWDALAGLIGTLKELYKNPRVVGHRDLSPDRNGDGTVEPREWLKTCPNFDVAAWLKLGMQPPIKSLMEAAA